MSLIQLTSRGVIKVSGPDATKLLNGLLTNDVAQAGVARAVYAAMLTPQGKYLFDMFVISPQPDVFLIDVSRPIEFAKRLAMYRLRSHVTIEDVSLEMGVYAGLGGTVSPLNAQAFVDPRLPELGHRFIAPPSEAEAEGIYTTHCLKLGVPDPTKDLIIEKDFLMEGLFDELHGIDFHKGCYVGQEMTSRMKRRTSVKNKLCRVRFEGPPPPFDALILADNWEVGRMRTGTDGVGMAMIRFDRARKALNEANALMAEGVAITLDPPIWLVEPQANSVLWQSP